MRVWGLVQKEGALSSRPMYGVSFPDFPGCVAAGMTMEVVLHSGAEALARYFQARQRDGFAMSAPSTFAALQARIGGQEIDAEEAPTWHLVDTEDGTMSEPKFKVGQMVQVGPTGDRLRGAVGHIEERSRMDLTAGCGWLAKVEFAPGEARWFPERDLVLYSDELAGGDSTKAAAPPRCRGLRIEPAASGGFTIYEAADPKAVLEFCVKGDPWPDGLNAVRAVSTPAELVAFLAEEYGAASGGIAKAPEPVVIGERPSPSHTAAGERRVPRSDPNDVTVMISSSRPRDIGKSITVTVDAGSSDVLAENVLHALDEMRRRWSLNAGVGRVTAHIGAG